MTFRTHYREWRQSGAGRLSAFVAAFLDWGFSIE